MELLNDTASCSNPLSRIYRGLLELNERCIQEFLADWEPRVTLRLVYRTEIKRWVRSKEEFFLIAVTQAQLLLRLSVKSLENQ